jgi:hypothetical protein
MFEAHINVEIPVNSTSIKYLYKYITKGHDCSFLSLENTDETKAYLDTRYVGLPEGEQKSNVVLGLKLTITYVLSCLATSQVPVVRLFSCIDAAQPS